MLRSFERAFSHYKTRAQKRKDSNFRFLALNVHKYIPDLSVTFQKGTRKPNNPISHAVQLVWHSSNGGTMLKRDWFSSESIVNFQSQQKFPQRHFLGLHKGQDIRSFHHDHCPRQHRNTVQYDRWSKKMSQSCLKVRWMAMYILVSRMAVQG